MTVSTFRRAVEALPIEGPRSVGAAIASGAPGASPEDLARLTEVLAESGSFIGEPTAERIDIASTGGPGSLTTLLAPLLAASDALVSKIAVPGRPAGGIDTLGSIPGFEAELDPSDARAVLDSCGYLHTAAGRYFCPLDAAFFDWRKDNGAQAIPELAIASLLSKKLAAGVGRVVLDIRIGPHGNFGADPDAASNNAHRFIEVANILGIDAICAFSGISGVAQPYIGRGEALVALDQALSGTASGWLLRHVNNCLNLASLARGHDASQKDVVPRGAAQVHRTMLREHGVNMHKYDQHVDRVRHADRVEIVAQATGYLQVDIEGIRRVLVDRQTNATPSEYCSFGDPCGVILEATANDRVLSGHLLATVRDQYNPRDLAESLGSFIGTSRAPSDLPADDILRIIR